MDNFGLDKLTLGKAVGYADKYDPSLLQAVERRLSREQINLPKELPFSGVDIWNGYEVSWLNKKGKPLIGILRCHVPVTSPNLIESKSFKLYLNSFNQTSFDSLSSVKAAMQEDLSRCAGEQVALELFDFASFKSLKISTLEGDLLDDLDVTISNYDIRPESLTTSNEMVEETLVSHLLKSNCLITHQPDWGSILIKYKGHKLDHEALLKYLISFRQHNEFHEQCVERIFYDILTHCKPEKLTVYARYTRRGGLDINPFRSNFEAPYGDKRLARQ
ncbi:NADPH-dependent 7-cyano-7-deazaguanine reductase QueF [Glaciecola siphonariae]|uniref:NADPH-dependent 7-cyano-7-deazaguanine reductase n=1 Tax=Glaciecola siphonariae TaxID=521012 RepID=A0ABV9LU52_9ALTE